MMFKTSDANNLDMTKRNHNALSLSEEVEVFKLIMKEK